MAKKNRPQEDRAEVDDYRRILRLGIPLGTQPEAARFRAALVRLLDDSQAGDGPPIEFHNDLTTDTVRAEFQSAVLAIVLELLHNARRHSKSKSILLGITRDDEYVCVQVQDWGVGFDLECEQPLGRGLKGIRHLVAWFGGTLDIDSRCGKGTCVMVEIPLSWESGPNNQTALAEAKMIGSSVVVSGRFPRTTSNNSCRKPSGRFPMSHTSTIAWM